MEASGGVQVREHSLTTPAPFYFYLNPLHSWGGGILWFEWVPTVEWLRGVEALNVKVKGRCAPLEAKKEGQSTSH